MKYHFSKTLIFVISLLILLSGFSLSAQKKININTAGVKELAKLPRIGEKIAKRIISFRKNNGKFKKIEEIMKVKGIGEKTFEKLKPEITI